MGGGGGGGINACSGGGGWIPFAEKKSTAEGERKEQIPETLQCFFSCD